MLQYEKHVWQIHDVASGIRQTYQSAQTLLREQGGATSDSKRFRCEEAATSGEPGAGDACATAANQKQMQL
jgi:hypothetical protein